MYTCRLKWFSARIMFYTLAFECNINRRYLNLEHTLSMHLLLQFWHDFTTVTKTSGLLQYDHFYNLTEINLAFHVRNILIHQFSNQFLSFKAAISTPAMICVCTITILVDEMTTYLSNLFTIGTSFEMWFLPQT